MNNKHFMDISHFIFSFISWWKLGFFPLFHWLLWIMLIYVYICFCSYDFISFQCKPKERNCWITLTLSLLEDCHNNYKRGCTILHSNQQCMISLYPHQLFLIFVVWIVVIVQIWNGISQFGFTFPFSKAMFHQGSLFFFF